MIARVKMENRVGRSLESYNPHEGQVLPSFWRLLLKVEHGPPSRYRPPRAAAATIRSSIDRAREDGELVQPLFGVLHPREGQVLPPFGIPASESGTALRRGSARFRIIAPASLRAVSAAAPVCRSAAPAYRAARLRCCARLSRRCGCLPRCLAALKTASEREKRRRGQGWRAGRGEVFESRPGLPEQRQNGRWATGAIERDGRQSDPAGLCM